VPDCDPGDDASITLWEPSSPSDDAARLGLVSCDDLKGLTAAYAPDVDELVARAVGLMWNVFPGYSADRFPRTELDPFVRAHIELTVNMLGRGVGPDYAELHPARELGARRPNRACHWNP
jgi:hypothetical protein